MPFWEFEAYVNPIANGLVLYCGDTNLKSDDGKVWRDTTNADQPFVFEMSGHEKDGKHFVCRDNVYAETKEGYATWQDEVTGEIKEAEYHLMVLCDGVLRSKRGFTAAATDIESIAPGTFKALHEKGALKPGTANLQFSRELEWVISVTVVHELFHVAWREKSRSPFTLAWVGT
jgi:hypothetical protein